MRLPRRLLATAVAVLAFGFAVHPSLLIAQDTLPGVALERRLADALQLDLDDTVRFAATPTDSGRRFVVRAIYRARPDPATVLRGEPEVRLHLPDLAALLGHPDRVDRFAVASRPGVSPDSTAAEINRAAVGYRAYPARDILRESSRTFVVVSRFHRAIAVIAISASAIFLLCIMLLKVEERRLDVAVLRLIGIGRRTIVRAFVLEACLVASLGSVVGIGLAALASALTNAIYQRRFDTTLVFSVLTPRIVLFSALLSIALGVVVGALAAHRLVRGDPLTPWRRRA